MASWCSGDFVKCTSYTYLWVESYSGVPECDISAKKSEWEIAVLFLTVSEQNYQYHAITGKEAL